jgi:ABC-2 type transport system ATP-binding protein
MTPVIEAIGLTKTFDGRKAVDDIGFSVPRGCVCGFLGPNGAGKTTTMRIILGLSRPDAGRVTVFGFPQGDPRALARTGALIEQPSLYGHLTGRENIEITRVLRGVARTETDKVLEAVGMLAEADMMSSQCSLGMRQRLGVAMALIGDPELLILDEPMNGLDPEGILDMRELVRSLPARIGTTILLSSHILAEVEQVADRLMVIHRGKLKYDGTLREFGAGSEATLRVRVAEADVQSAIAILSSLGLGMDTDACVITVRGASRSTAEGLMPRLVAAGVIPIEMTSVEASLESRFLAMVRES